MKGAPGFPTGNNIMETFTVRRITDTLYSITENILGNQFPVLIYLVIGTERAALIDTGIGTGNLRGFVESVTGLPIIVLHTHGHLDHVGADALFDEVYLNYKELGSKDSINFFREVEEQRLKFIETQLKDTPDLIDKFKKYLIGGVLSDYQDVNDGDIFDLGGIRLEAVATPGHTAGSISFVNKADGYAFTGDGIGDIHWFDRQDSIGVEGFLHTLNHFEKKAQGVVNIYAAHIANAFGLDLIHDLQRAAIEILEGADDKIENADYQFLLHGDLYAHRSGNATIYYKKENVHS